MDNFEITDTYLKNITEIPNEQLRIENGKLLVRLITLDSELALDLKHVEKMIKESKPQSTPQPD